jgi:hypothetical protein
MRVPLTRSHFDERCLMSVHWDSNSMLKNPMAFDKQVMLAARNRTQQPAEFPKPKCRKCHKRFRGAGHDCKNGK